MYGSPCIYDSPCSSHRMCLCFCSCVCLWLWLWQIEMYNSLVEKTGSEGEEEARAAYAAAREASEREATADTEEAEGEGVSEALISKVSPGSGPPAPCKRALGSEGSSGGMQQKSMTDVQNMAGTGGAHSPWWVYPGCTLPCGAWQVDTMLHQLEKELDRVDAKIGSKLRILDT